MAKLQFFHETDQPRLAMLKPFVPAMDQRNVAEGHRVTAGSGPEDKRPAVWLWLAQGSGHAPYSQPPLPYRYVVEIDEEDEQLLRFDHYPDCYRYLASVSSVGFHTLDPDTGTYCSREDWVAEYSIAKERLDLAHKDFRQAVQAALDTGSAEKSALHALALVRKKQLSTAAKAEGDAYEALMTWELSAPEHLATAR